MPTSDSEGQRTFPEPEGERWQVLRAGLQNIWEYDDQRFVFHRGRLLLRGANESGKTKVLEVLLPFLLDADLSPPRLDPFGSTSRSMRWNLIGEHNPDVGVAIGYVWLELGRRERERSLFCTIGAGLRAKRSTPGVDVWYFKTSKRPDRDLRLLDERRVPLVQGALSEAILGTGMVYESKRDYRQAINQELFGMPEEQYGALIEALLQLRRPQLSKQLEPDELSRILSASLPPLEARVIAPLAEGFERLDRHRAERETLEQALSAVRGFVGIYRDYVASVARGFAQEVTKADSAYQRARAGLRRAQEEHEATLRRQTERAARIETLEEEEVALAERVQTLKASDAYRAIEELDRAEQAAREHALRSEKAETRLAGERRELDERRGRAEASERAEREEASRLASARASAAGHAAQAALESAHRVLDVQAEGGDVDAARGTLDSAIGERQAATLALEEHASRVEEARHQLQQADQRLREADERVAAAEAALASAERAEAEAHEQFDLDVSDWTQALSVLKLDEVTRARLLDSAPGERRALVERLAADVTAGLDEEAAEVGTARGELGRRIETTILERDRLAAATHQPPEAPPWRSPRPPERPGAPLYLLCDFQVPDTRGEARLEAALEAAGLLDAWITPEGEVLDPDTFDVRLAPDPRPGPSLADVLAPIEAGGVGRPVVERVLRTIGLVADGNPPPDASCWVATDGRWRNGPLQGAWRKESCAYIGAAARERERARRLAGLYDLLRELEDTDRDLERRRQQVRDRRERLHEERGLFPDMRALLAAEAEAGAVQRQVTLERTARAVAAEARERSERDLGRVIADRDVEAANRRLTTWVDALPELREKTHRYREAAWDMLHEARELARRREALEECRRAMAEARRRTEAAQADVDEARQEGLRSEARAAALRDALGSSRDELIAAVREADERQRSLRRELAGEREQKSAGDRRLGEASGLAQAAEKEVAAAEEKRRGAEGDFKHFALRGLLPVVEVALAASPEAWTLTETLLTARQVDAALGDTPCSPEARDRYENRVVEKHQDLGRALPAEVRIFPHREGVLEYRASWNGRPRSLLELLADLVGEIASRERLLGDEERALFESFLSGETHEHLRRRLREAYELVKRMNAQLEARPTASGMQLRLKWDVTGEAPPGAGAAIDLLLRSGHLLSDADRGALQQFLKQRLDEARGRDGLGTLQERMLAVLDYRSWYSFTIEFRAAGLAWSRLTKKAHGAGSGGQKAVMLHMPLFAAAAAFYHSAMEIAPRLIVLDEAFAGIDRTMRGKLMGLLAEFDLAFLMTSYEEWGFYEELDGLSTYHLSREKGMRGVYADWFLWDGKQALHVGA